MQAFHFAEQRRRWDDLYRKLVGSCYAAGVPLSSPSENDPPAQPQVLPIAEQLQDLHKHEPQNTT